MVVIANKYDLMKCFSYRGRRWFNRDFASYVWSDPLSCYKIEWGVRLLWVMNELGLKDNVYATMVRLITLLHIDDDGDLTLPRVHNTDKAQKVKDISSLLDQECLGESLFINTPGSNIEERQDMSAMADPCCS